MSEISNVPASVTGRAGLAYAEAWQRLRGQRVQNQQQYRVEILSSQSTSPAQYTSWRRPMTPQSGKAALQTRRPARQTPKTQEPTLPRAPAARKPNQRLPTLSNVVPNATLNATAPANVRQPTGKFISKAAAERSRTSPRGPQLLVPCLGPRRIS